MVFGRLKVTLEIFGRRYVTAILILAMAGGVLCARGVEQTGDALSAPDKTEIVESVLKLELKAQVSVSEFRYVRNLSSTNIEFLEPSRATAQGFVLLDANQIMELQRSQFVEYFVFRRIELKDGVAVIVLTLVNESRPCFGKPSSSERSFTYEFRKTFGQWSGQLVRASRRSPQFGTSFLRKM